MNINATTKERGKRESNRINEVLKELQRELLESQLLGKKLLKEEDKKPTSQQRSHAFDQEKE